MGCRSSKFIGSNNKAAEYDAELISSYEEACRLVPELRSFGSLPKMKEWFIKNHDFLPLTKEYLKNAAITMKLLDAVKLSFSKARNGQAIVLNALQCYEKEKKDSKRYSLTLSKLKEFKEAGAPFANILNEEFGSVCKQQRATLKELCLKKHKLEEKLGSVKAWRKAWRVIYTSAFMLVLVCSVVLAAVAAPPVATVTAAAGSTAMKTAEQYFESIWSDRLGALEGEKDVVVMMRKGSFGVHELESIQAMVKRLEIRVRSVLGDAEFALREEEEEVEAVAVEVAVEEIKSKVGVIAESIDGLETKVDACVNEIGKAVIEFFKVITMEM